MDKLTYQNFVESMKQIDPTIIDLADALFAAMGCVSHNHRSQFFGPIRQGVFYMDSKRHRWYADANPFEAISNIRMEFGDGIADSLEEMIIY